MTDGIDDRLADWEARLDRLEGRPELAVGRYAVLRFVRSPLPRDPRRCAYLEAT